METVDPLLATGKDRGRVVRELMALGESWVAEADGVVTGFAIASHHFFARPFVDLLVVADDRRRLGIGTALMGACEAAHDDDRMFTSTNVSAQDPTAYEVSLAIPIPTVTGAGVFLNRPKLREQGKRRNRLAAENATDVVEQGK